MLNNEKVLHARLIKFLDSEHYLYKNRPKSNINKKQIILGVSIHRYEKSPLCVCELLVSVRKLEVGLNL